MIFVDQIYNTQEPSLVRLQRNQGKQIQDDIGNTSFFLAATPSSGVANIKSFFRYVWGFASLNPRAFDMATTFSMTGF